MTDGRGTGLTNRKVFVLGDSRTGTTSLHQFLRRHGFRSVHYFVQQSGVSQPMHMEAAANARRVLDYVAESGFQCFSDYPTRLFWRELAEAHPDALFILTTRRDVATWRRSMAQFFATFEMQLNLDGLEQVHVQFNEAIRRHFAQHPSQFLELVIDDDGVENGARLCAFLGISPPTALTRENTSEGASIDRLSSRANLFGSPAHPSEPVAQVLGQARRAIHQGKAMLGEFGWLYLVNDTNDFLSWQFGLAAWSEEQAEAARQVLLTRIALLKASGAQYRKFIVPEKSVVYREYLPLRFAGLQQSESRPAQLLARDLPEHVCHLDVFLKDARSWGQLYFRGDTHPNWLGAFLMYRHIQERLALARLVPGPPLSLSALRTEVAQYDGDLFTQLEPYQREVLDQHWGWMSGTAAFELTLRLTLPAEQMKAKRISGPTPYLGRPTIRETLVYEQPNSNLPRAVIFRDSTMDFAHALLAQHFSRSVFVWFEGAVVAEVLEAERPDLVLHVMAERFVSSYPGAAPIARWSPG